VVVLPFFNLTKSANLDWIGESISESVLEALAGAGHFVADREARDEMMRRLSVRRYAVLTRASVLEVALNLDAGQAVSGEFVLQPGAGPRLAITVRVTDLKQMRRGVEFTAAGPLEELSLVQDKLVARVLASLGSSAPAAAARPAIRLDALENYVRGLMAATEPDRARLWATAARLEPGFSWPCFRLGRLYYDQGDYRSAAGWLAKVRTDDTHYREAQFYLALSLYENGEYALARDAYMRIVQEAPLSEVYNNLGATQLHLNETDALESFLKALEGDPADPEYHFNAGYALWRLGQFEPAAERFRSALGRNPEDQQATTLLGRCLKRSGPRPGDLKTEGLEIIKTTYNEAAWRQLKAMVERRPLQ
jgi:tetratricopeptide (TPR) repeat protein